MDLVKNIKKILILKKYLINSIKMMLPTMMILTFKKVKNEIYKIY
jgi:hypothetical protein